MDLPTATTSCISSNKGDCGVKILKRLIVLAPRRLWGALLIGVVTQLGGPLAAQSLPVPMPQQVQGSPVAEAARQGDRQAVQALLQQGLDVNSWDSGGTPALHWAVHFDDQALVALPLTKSIRYFGGTSDPFRCPRCCVDQAGRAAPRYGRTAYCYLAPHRPQG